MSEHLISVVLPVRNQADHIATVVRAYEEVLAALPCPHELLLVVNNCRDDSPAVCRGLAEEYAAIRIVSSDRGGWGLAVRLGLAAARGDLLGYTNSARTAPHDLLRILRHALAHPDKVVTARRKGRVGWLRRLGSLLYNFECRRLLGLTVQDVNGTPKVFPRSFDRLQSLTRDDDLLDAELHLVCHRESYPILEVPIFAARRHGGRSTTTLRSAAKLYWGAYRLWRDARRAG
jgi:glycosyltransferase involved in cell wall biosynthesis